MDSCICVRMLLTAMAKHKNRYQKLSREMPQTAWVVDGGQRMGKASVEEVVAEPIKEVSRRLLW